MSISNLIKQSSNNRYLPFYSSVASPLPTTLGTVYEVSGAGYIDCACILVGGGAEKTFRVKVTVDGAVIFDSSRTISSPSSSMALGIVLLLRNSSLNRGFGTLTSLPYINTTASATAPSAITSKPIYFNNNLKVEVTDNGNGFATALIAGGLKV